MRTCAPHITIATTLITAGVCLGAPAQADTGAAPAAVGFTATVDDSSAILTIDSGALVVEKDILEIHGTAGSLLGGAELSFRIDDFVFPIDAEIRDRTATLTPRLDLAHAVYQPVALPFEDTAPFKTPYEREQAAWARMTSTIGVGVSIGALVGGIGGATVGCVLGGIAGATVAAATIVGMFGPFIPAAAVGCLGGVAAIGAIGAVAGQLLVAAPIAVAAAAQYFATINAPMPPYTTR
ncbi:hypothetical protein ASD42_26395 [Nocardia sp. Root136]|uniref:hypothetical protein n=1 Tax=Nocardia sp. Root136 TaxID=1736458 RepID=UPI0007005DF2|nr:hypothetical protein [Nocardia sp. Root136]KQY29031.1 hypothetical protein ASD42_26395 [Nocardia sp. Root136]